jgi:hypothetical protein
MAARELSNRLYGSRACVVTDTKRFVSDEFMVSSLDPNLEVGGTLRVHYYNNLSFYFRSILSNNHNPALDKFKVVFFASITMYSTVKPNFCCRAFSGAEGQQVSRPSW